MKMKIIFRFIAIVLSISVVLGGITPIENVRANEAERIRKIVLNDSSYVTVQDKGYVCIAEYYENGRRLQVAKYNAKSGNVMYSEYLSANERMDISKNCSDKPIKTEVYSVERFKNNTIDTEKKLQLNSRGFFTQLKTKTVYIDGIPHSRILLGYSDIKQYQEGNWTFPTGTAISVIVSITSFLGITAAIIGAIVTVVGGSILSEFSVKYWIKDYFWKYRFMQTSPSYMDFISSLDFTYKRERKIELNGDEGYWETIYEKPYSQIEYERNDILDNPGFYY